MRCYLYILKCRDGRYYVGSARHDLDRRLAQHHAGESTYTATRRPLELIFVQEFEDPRDLVAMERRLKGWTRAKKEAYMASDIATLRTLARRRTSFGTPRPPGRGSSG